jgi:hypothetical protein
MENEQFCACMYKMSHIVGGEFNEIVRAYPLKKISCWGGIAQPNSEDFYKWLINNAWFKYFQYQMNVMQSPQQQLIFNLCFFQPFVTLHVRVWAVMVLWPVKHVKL